MVTKTKIIEGVMMEINIDDLIKHLDGCINLTRKGHKPEYKIDYFSGYKPASYFVSQIVFSTKQAARTLGTSNGNISSACLATHLNKRCTILGYIWKYKK